MMNKNRQYISATRKCGTFFVQALEKYLYSKQIMFVKIDPYIVYQNRDKNGNVIGKMNRNDIILTLGAGNVTEIGPMLLK